MIANFNREPHKSRNDTQEISFNMQAISLGSAQLRRGWINQPYCLTTAPFATSHPAYQRFGNQSDGRNEPVLHQLCPSRLSR